VEKRQKKEEIWGIKREKYKQGTKKRKRGVK